MSEWSCFLVSVSNGDYLRKCAIKVKDAPEFFMESDGKRWLHARLPLHVRNYGRIVDIEQIYDVRIVEEIE